MTLAIQRTRKRTGSRARDRDVILEMGMIMAALGRGKMAILKKGALEMPSDADGIIRIKFPTIASKNRCRNWSSVLKRRNQD